MSNGKGFPGAMAFGPDAVLRIMDMQGAGMWTSHGEKKLEGSNLQVAAAAAQQVAFPASGSGTLQPKPGSQRLMPPPEGGTNWAWATMFSMPTPTVMAVARIAPTLVCESQWPRWYGKMIPSPTV